MGNWYRSDSFLEYSGTEMYWQNSQKHIFSHNKTQTFDLGIKKVLVLVLIQCHFDYVCSSWYSGLNETTKLKFKIAENKML